MMRPKCCFRQTGPDGFEGAEVSGFELRTRLLLQRAFHRTVDSVAGITDHRIQAPLALDDPGDDGFGTRAVIDIQHNWDDAFAGVLDGTPAASGIYFHSGIGQQMGGGGTDTAAASGYQDNFYFFHNSDLFTKWSGRGIS